MTTVEEIISALGGTPVGNSASYRVVLSPSHGLHLAIDSQGFPSLLVPVAKLGEARNFVLGVIRVATYAKVRFDIGETTRQASAVVVTCMNRERPQSFSVFLLDLIHRLQNEKAETIVTVESALREWHEMLTRQERLGTEQEIGLWGELVVLRGLPNLSRAVECWTGPSRDHVDFRGAAVALECKTSRARLRHALSLEQVEQVQAELVETYLVSIWIGSDPAGDSLPEMIDSIERGLSSTTTLRRRLLQVGYAYEQRNQYAERFALLSDPVLVRMSDVPRVRQVDSGVSGVRFVAELDACNPVDTDEVGRIYRRLVGGEKEAE